MKVALFKSIITDRLSVWDEGFTNPLNSYVRVSEWVDVHFPSLDDNDMADKVRSFRKLRLAALESEIADLKAGL